MTAISQVFIKYNAKKTGNTRSKNTRNIIANHFHTKYHLIFFAYTSFPYFLLNKIKKIKKK